jgi:hypothetical protein
LRFQKLTLPGFFAGAKSKDAHEALYFVEKSGLAGSLARLTAPDLATFPGATQHVVNNCANVTIRC